MGATRFEFEYRFWVIGAIIGIGFALGAVDRVGFADFVLRLIEPGINPDSVRGTRIEQAIIGFGALLVFCAAFFRTWATAWLGADVVFDKHQHSEALTADGPYRHVRNPLYLANLPLIAGIGCLASRSGWAFMVVGMLVFVWRLILREEAGLQERLGDDYTRYAARVPRLWPSMRPRCPLSGRAPHWRQAFVGEILFWLMGVTLLVFAITINQTLLAVGFAASFAITLATGSYVRKRSAAPPPEASAGP